MDTFLEKYLSKYLEKVLSKLTHERKESRNNPIIVFKIISKTWNVTKKKMLDPDGFIGMFYQTDRNREFHIYTNSSRALFLLGQPNLDSK